MSVLKRIVKMGEIVFAGSKKTGLTNWIRIKDSYKKNMQSKGGIHSMNVMVLHVRNGTRGNGIGMGRQIKMNRLK